MRLKPMVSAIIFLRFIRFRLNLHTAKAGGVHLFSHSLGSRWHLTLTFDRPRSAFRNLDYEFSRDQNLSLIGRLLRRTSSRTRGEQPKHLYSLIQFVIVTLQRLTSL